MKSIKNMFDKMKYKHTWDKFYEKDKRDINVPNISIYDCINSSFDDDELIANYLNANNITNHLFFDKELLTNDSDLDTETISKSIKSLKQNRSKTKKIIRAKNL